MITENSTSDPKPQRPPAVLRLPPQPTVYTQEQMDAAEQITEWLKARDLAQAWMARKTRIASGTISQVLRGIYPADPGTHIDTMMSVIRVETERLGDGSPGYVETSVHKLVSVVCNRTRKHANIGVICGVVGIGKTRTLAEYRVRSPQTLLVESNPRMTAQSLLNEMLDQLGLAQGIGLDTKFDTLVRALRDTNYLLIVDEAENLGVTALHYVRRLRDKARIGVVLAGTERLHDLLKPEFGQFDQIRSRVSMWPETIRGITRDDMDYLARDALRDAGPGYDPSDDVLDTLWEYCGGSARVLMESLIPALKDFVLGRQPLSAAAVDQVARKVLFLSRKRRSTEAAATGGRA